MTMQQYCLRWNNHQPNFISVFSSLLNSESLVDVTLAAEGRHLQAHKVVLSACSSYFQSLFTINPCQHPIVILKDVKFADLKIIIDFMYYGEVNVSQEQLPYILKTAETLKIKGLAEIPVDQSVAKTQNNMMEKTELLTPGDPNWGSDGGPRQSVSPVPCPLSPSSKRKRLRKSSTGSGSGSTERASDEHHSGEMTLTSSGSSLGGTVIKADPGGYASDTGTMLQKSKQHSSDSELHRGSSHESMEGEMTHHVTLQVPQDVSVQHSLEAATSVEVAGPSSNTSQLSLGGMQWNVMEHAAYAQFSSCASPTALMPSSPPFGGPQGGGLGGGGNQHHPHHHHHQQQHHQHQQQHHQLQGGQTGGGGGMNPPSPTNSQCYQSQIANSPPQMIQKRKRSINPQGDENFIRALEAVRFGGIGFCKAARMYGVNNRTLWLEYKKRGYPNFRLSIKKRNQEGATVSTPGLGVQVQGDVSEPPPSPSPHTPDHSPLSLPDKQEVQDQQMCAAAQSASAHPVALISSAFFDGKHVDLGSVLQSRPKYLETTLMNSQQGAINYHNINYEQM